MPKTEATRGERWRADVEAAYTLNESDAALVIEAADVMDEIDRLSPGAVVERRQQRTLLARLLGALALPPPDESAGDRRSETSAKARKAARARWSKVNGQGA